MTCSDTSIWAVVNQTLLPVQLVWTSDPTREEGSREEHCLEVSSWNAMVSEFSKLPLSDLQRDWSGTTPIFLKWCSFPHQHWQRHSSAQDTSEKGFSADPSSRVGSGVQTTVQESGYTRLQLTRYWNDCGSQTHSYYSLVVRWYRYQYRP